MNDLFLLIDGNSLINRAYYALPPLNTSDGKPSNAVYGFCTMLIKAVQDYKPTRIAVAFDLPAPTFRHIEYKEYKATRKGMPDDLAVQMPMLKELLADMGIKTVELAGYEADDIIGTLSACSCPTVIVTGDRDALQLVDDCTTVAYTKRGITNLTQYTTEVFKAEFGFMPASIVDYKALAGDASDNIPGVSGIGGVTATALIAEYATLDNVYANLDKIAPKTAQKLEAGREDAYLSRRLAAINRCVPLDCSFDACGFCMPFSAAVKNRFYQYNFGSLLKRDELFEPETKGSIAAPAEKNPCEHIEVADLSQIKITDGFAMAFDAGAEVISIACGNVQYDVKLARGFLGEGFDAAAVIDYLKPFLEGSAITKTVLDAKALKKQLKAYGAALNNFFDVKLAAYLIDSFVKFEGYEEFCGGVGYPRSDAAYALLKIAEGQREKLAELNMQRLYYEIELPLVDVLFGMENKGFKLDLGLAERLSAELNSRMEQISAAVYKECGKEFNLNSPKQLAVVLFEELKIPYPKKSGNYSTAYEILEPLSYRYPVVEKVLEYRHVAKLIGTYVEGLRKQADARGIVRTEFKQTVTATGRLSSVEPNLQNIPIRDGDGKRLRAMFVAREGCTLVSADYSQIELRLLAHFSDDPVMVAAFNNDEDIHEQTAAKVFGVPLNEVTAEMRQSAKAVNFGIVYGMSDFGLAERLRIPVFKAKEMIDRYFDRFKGVREYLKKSVASAYEKGYAETLFGRIRKIPELKSSNTNMKKFGERVAMNMPLQGSAADAIKAAMISADKRLKEKGASLILQVHDELIAECNDADADEVREILKDCMENAVSLLVPLSVSIACGKSWLDC